MSIDRDTIRHLERLARLRLDDGEANALAKDLGRIVEFVRAVEDADTGGAHSFVRPARAPRRADETAPGLDRDRVMEQAPEESDGSFVVPRVIERPEE